MSFEEIVGKSDALQSVLRRVESIGRSDAPVLITGETGTGKEVVARAIHQNSGRANKPFVAINCAAPVGTLLESELLGHEKGAFIGANVQKKGKLEVAEGGTVFLDEIGELAPSLQVKLLRVLQEREFERVGGARTIKLDVRLIAATNRDMEEEVRKGRFREDLYCRLNVVSVRIPALRERREDIPLLAQYFVDRSSRTYNKTLVIPSEAMTALAGYDWPGNIRELENAIASAVILSEGPTLEIDSKFFQRDTIAVGDQFISNVEESRPIDENDIAIAFDPSLSPEQIVATLTALANYYRACGGVGLSVEFENQEAVSEGVHA